MWIHKNIFRKVEEVFGIPLHRIWFSPLFDLIEKLVATIVVNISDLWDVFYLEN